MIEVWDFLGDPLSPNPMFEVTEKKYLMGDGYIDVDPKGMREKLRVWAWRVQNAMKNTLLDMMDIGVDAAYDCIYGKEVSQDEGLGFM
jgi:hypothetical protein